MKTGYVIAVLSIAFFALCLLWGLILSDPALKELHSNLLRIAYPGFGYNLLGILVGAVETFIYGWLFGVLLAWLCKKMCVVDGSSQ